jgi:hypothetical protein
MVTEELLNHIKSEVAKGQSIEVIKTSLLGAGWTSLDVDEAFQKINTTPSQSAQAVNVAKKSKSPMFKIVAIILLLGVLGFGGWWVYSQKIKKSDTSLEDVSVGNSEYVQTTHIKILHPLIGSEIVSGSDLEVKYEITTDIPPYTDISPNDKKIVILVGSTNDNCGDSFNVKPKGVYTFVCHGIGKNQVGSSPVMIVEGAHSVQEKPLVAYGQIKIVSATNLNPVEIIPGGSVSFDGSLEVYVPVGSESDENVAASQLDPQVKFSDGTIKNVPFTDFTYSFDDPTLVRFYPPGGKVPVFIGNRVGKTILHLQYKGIKKDISIRAVSDATTPQDPSTYQKIYNTSSTSLGDFRTMCKQKNGTLQENPDELTCTSKSGNYFISVKGK